MLPLRPRRRAVVQTEFIDARRLRDQADSTSPTLPRPQIVERIIAGNPSATAEFLAGFGDAALAHYLEHLIVGDEPRGRTSRWVRRAESPAIVRREAAE